MNGRFGTVGYTPVRYIKQYISTDDLVALFALADVALVSSTR